MKDTKPTDSIEPTALQPVQNGGRRPWDRPAIQEIEIDLVTRLAATGTADFTTAS